VPVSEGGVPVPESLGVPVFGAAPESVAAGSEPFLVVPVLDPASPLPLCPVPFDVPVPP
jgi:hypothetical protein